MAEKVHLVLEILAKQHRGNFFMGHRVHAGGVPSNQ